MKDEDDGFVTAIANAITKKTLERLHDAKAEVDVYLNNHLESIILLGLGITKDSWNSYRFEGVNNFSGLIKDYICNLAREAASSRADELIKTIMENRTKEMLSKGLGEDARRVYAEAYKEKLHGLIREHLSSREESFREKLKPVVKETGMRLNALASDQLRALIKSIKAGSL